MKMIRVNPCDGRWMVRMEEWTSIKIKYSRKGSDITEDIILELGISYHQFKQEWTLILVTSVDTNTPWVCWMVYKLFVLVVRSPVLFILKIWVDKVTKLVTAQINAIALYHLNVKWKVTVTHVTQGGGQDSMSPCYSSTRGHLRFALISLFHSWSFFSSHSLHTKARRLFHFKLQITCQLSLIVCFFWLPICSLCYHQWSHCNELTANFTSGYIMCIFNSNAMLHPIQLHRTHADTRI